MRTPARPLLVARCRLFAGRGTPAVSSSCGGQRRPAVPAGTQRESVDQDETELRAALLPELAASAVQIRRAPAGRVGPGSTRYGRSSILSSRVRPGSRGIRWRLGCGRHAGPVAPTGRMRWRSRLPEPLLGPARTDSRRAAGRASPPPVRPARLPEPLLGPALTDSRRAAGRASPPRVRPTAHGRTRSRPPAIRPWDGLQHPHRLFGDRTAHLSGVGSEATQISGTEEKPLEITADQLKALEEAALELAAIKLEEVSDLFTAAGRFAAARQISYLPEPEPLFPKIMGSHEKDKLRAIAAGRIVRAVYRGTLAQRRALERATRKHLQLDTRHVDPVALQVHKELTRTAILGDKVLSPLDVARVLKAEANVSGLHPNDLKTLKRIKVFGENVNTIAGVVVGTGSACGAISSLRHWNTSYPMSDLPEDFFW